MNTVEQQQIIAADVMACIKVVDPFALLAGGAPRDWYFGNPCNDLDIYYYSNAGQSMLCKEQLNEAMDCLDLTVAFKDEDWNEDSVYNTMPFIRRIFETKCRGLDIQFIQLIENKRQFDVVRSMDVSICQCWYNHYRDQIMLTDNFRKTVASKMMFLPNGNSWTDKHPTKMAERFPQYKKATESQVDNKLINQAIGEKQ